MNRRIYDDERFVFIIGSKITHILVVNVYEKVKKLFWFVKINPILKGLR